MSLRKKRTRQSIVKSRRNRERKRLHQEQLEQRQMLAAQNVLAQLAGEAESDAVAASVDFSVVSTDFTMQGGKTTLGFHVQPIDGSTFDAETIEVRDGESQVVPAVAENADPLGGGHVVLAEFEEGSYSLSIDAADGAAGQFVVDVFLAGDADADFDVDRDDISLIRSNFGSVDGDAGYTMAADADLDGRIGSFDLFRWNANRNDATSLRILSVEMQVNGETTLVETSSGDATLSGTTLPGTTIDFDTDGDGQYDDAQATADGVGDYSIDVTLPLGDYAVGARVSDTFGQVAVSTVDVSVAPAAITLVAPQNGERDVRLDRPLRVTFDSVIDPSTVNENNFYATVAGQRVTGQLRMGSDNKSIALYPDVMFPASTTARITVDGDAIRDMAGVPVDANGDGTPGGMGQFQFSTVGVTRLEGTSVFGYIFDSTRSNDGEDIPIVGVTLRVEGIPELTAVTDENGFFRLQDTPGTEFFVHFDMSAVTSAPEGFEYLAPAKPFHPIPGMDVPLGKADNKEFDIYFPLVNTAEGIEVTPGEMTVAQFGQAALDHLEEIAPDVPRSEWEKLSVEIPPNSLFFDDGTPAEEVQIFALDPQRIPAPLPGGVDPSIVFSIDAGGASDFGTPAKLTFPNVDGLAPGEERPIYTFDHDAGEWKITGRAIVSADASVLETDEGGVTTLGWKGVGDQPGVPDDRDADPDPNHPGNNPDGDNDPNSPADSDPDPEEVEEGTYAWGFDVTGEFDPLFATASLANTFSFTQLDILEERLKSEPDIDIFQVENYLDLLGNSITAFTEFDGSFRIGITDEPFEFDFGFGGQFTVESEWLRSFVPEFDVSIASIDVLAGFSLGGGIDFEFELKKGSNKLEFDIDAFLSASAGVSVAIDDSIACHIPLGIGDRICSSHQVYGVSARIDENGPDIKDGLFGNPFDTDEFFDVIKDKSRFDDLVEEIVTLPFVSPIDFEFSIGAEAMFQAGARAGVKVRASLEELSTTTRPIESLSAAVGVASASEGPVLQLLSSQSEETITFSVSESVGSGNPYYRYVLANGLEIAGRADSNGVFSAVLPPNTEYNLYVFDPATNTSTIVSGETGQAGSSEGGVLPLTFVGGFDNDADGLSSVAEFTIGSDPEVADSDGDGINDGAELLQGLNPLDGIAYPTGLVGNASISGEARDVVVTGTANSTATTAYLATGDFGLAIVDVSQFTEPSLLGQVNLAGDATGVAVSDNQTLAYVAAGSAGLHIVDVSDPISPSLVETINDFGSVTQLELLDNTIALATSGGVVVIDADSGEILGSRPLGPVTDIELNGGVLYAVVDNERLVSLDPLGDRGNSIVELDSVDIPVPPVRRVQPEPMRVFVANEVAYVSNGLEISQVSPGRPLERGGYVTFDVSDPSRMSLISNIDTGDFQAGNFQTVLNGSGLAVIAAGTRGVEIHDASDPNVTYAFLNQFDTPGTAHAVEVVGGIAFVADGEAGLQVINYRDFDALGVPPTISITADALDKDLDTPGIQVEENTLIGITPTVTDDVQARVATLIVNGEAVRTDLSFPYDFGVIVPSLSSGETTLEIQVQATDTGGNSVLSEVITLDIVPDSTPPELTSARPWRSALVNTKTATLRFNEPIDQSRVTLADIQIVDLADPENPLTPESIRFRGDGTVLDATLTNGLGEGDYELRVNESAFTDLAGNQLGDSTFVQPFGIRINGSSVFTNGTLFVEDDRDTNTFTFLAGDRVAVQVVSTTANTRLELKNSAGGVLAQDRSGGPGNDPYISHFVVQSSGRYEIDIISESGGGEYELRVDVAREGLQLETDNGYANDSTNGADTLGFDVQGVRRLASVTGTIMGAESSNLDQDLYRLGYLNTGTTIALDASGVPAWSTLLPFVEVVDSSGNPVAGDTDASDAVFRGTIDADGEYFARVSTRVAVIDGRRFTLTVGSDGWETVRAEAQFGSGDLASISSAEEDQLIFDTLGGNRWIGFTDSVTEGTYEWADGSPVEYTNWGPNEPNSSSLDYAFVSTDGRWYDSGETSARRGIIETESQDGDPLVAGVGLAAQYVLNIEVEDFVAPLVSSTGQLPAEGGTLERVLSTFSVTFSEELDPATIVGTAFELRGAGADGQFETGDDTVYGLSQTYDAANFRLNFTVTDGPLVNGEHRFTIANSLTDVLGNPLAAEFVRTFTVDAIPDGVVFEGSDNGSFDRATPLALTADTNGTGWLRSEVGFGSIDPTSDQDWWSFQGEAGDRVDVWLQQLSGLDPYVILYRLNDAGDGVQQLTSNARSGPGNTDYISGYALPATTTYFVQALNWSGSSFGEYDVRVHVQRDHRLETDTDYNNDSTNGADGLTFVESGNTRSASIAGTVMGAESTNLDEDLYQLGFLNAGTTVTLDATSLPGWSTLLPKVELVNASGVVMGLDEDDSEGVFRGTLDADGEYFARVSSAAVVIDGSRFTLTSQSDDWSVVREEAMAAGGDLASIESAEQGRLIRDTLGDNRWIGLTDEAIEGMFEWTDGSPLNYTNWSGGSPASAADSTSSSYDQVYTNGTSWRIGRNSSNRIGIVETAAEAGDPETAGSGINAQYVLNVEVADLVAPVVTSVSLPAEGGTLDRVLSTFSVTFSEELDPSTIVGTAFELRGAGADGQFETGDDTVYGLSQTYDAANFRLNFTVTDGPLVNGEHRFTIADSLTDVLGNPLAAEFVRTFTVDAIPDGVVFEGSDNGSFDRATPLALTADANGTGWLRSEVGFGSIDPTSDQDWWSFQGEAGDRVDVWLQQLSGLDPYVILYRLNDAGDGVQQLTSNARSGPGNTDYISGYALPATTTYFVQALNWSGSSFGEYDVRVHVQRDHRLETDTDYNNDSTNGADGLTFVESGNTRSASIAGTVMGAESTNLDEDLYQLGFLNAGTTVTLDATSLPGWSTLLPKVELVNASGVVMGLDEDDSEGVFRGTLDADGEYFARVSSAAVVIDGSRFTLTSQSDDWSVVREEAMAAGGDLASIESAEQGRLIRDTLGDNRWIGLTDEAIEGMFEWTDGSPLNYTNWSGGSPASAADSTSSSYDQVYTNGTSWRIGRNSSNRIGIVETAAEAGDPETAGSGINAQYVLNVEVADLVAPVVTSVSLPAEGGTLDRVLSTFSVTFSEELDPSTIVGTAFELRGAGADGQFETGDDTVYGLSQTYDAANFRLNFTVTDGPLVNGEHRFTIANSLTDVLGNPLAAEFVRTFTVDAIPDGVVFEGSDNGSFDRATPLALTADTNGTGWLRSEVGFGSIDPTSDQDWWSFQGEAGDRVDVWLQQLSGLDPYVILYRLNDAGDGVQQLTSNARSGPGNTDYISGYALPATTTYFVQALNWSGSSFGEYDVRVHVQRDHRLETDTDYNNDSTNGADGLTFVESGNTRSASIAGTVMGAESTNLDEDLYQLGFLNAGTTVTLDATSLPGWSTLLPKVELVNASGVVMGLDEDDSEGVFRGTLDADGEYFARVSSAAVVIDGSRFTLTSQSDDWSVVREEAMAAGGDLASIESAEQGRLIRDTLGDNRWIGLTDEAIEGMFEWTDGSPLNYTNWSGGSPASAADSTSSSYDQVYTNGTSWRIGRNSSNRIGIVETAAEAGDPETAGSGINAQYVLNVEVADLVAPVVTSVSLPAEGGTLDRVLSTFSVTFSEELDPSTIVGTAFELRGAGADGQFETGDDTVYGLSQTYDAANFRLNFTVTDGPLVNGEHRFTIADSLTDVLGNPLAAEFVRTFTVDAIPDGVVFEGSDNGSFDRATPLALTADANGTGWLRSEVGFGSIDPTSDQDWWSFQGEAGDRVDVWLQQLSGLDPYVILYRLNDAGDGVQQLTSNARSGPGNTDYISGYALPATTTYFVQALNWSGSSFGEYDVRVHVQRDHRLETDTDYNNDSTNGADGLTFVESGNTRSASIAGTVMGGENGNVDEDYFALGTVEVGERVQISMSLPTWSNLSPIVELRNSSNQVIEVFENPLDGPFEFEPASDDSYFIAVASSGGEGIFGQYSVRIEITAPE